MLNIGAISDIIDRQSIKFDYQFYQKDFETNITSIILTHGKSLLPSGKYKFGFKKLFQKLCQKLRQKLF